jgi:hypothetical protein
MWQKKHSKLQSWVMLILIIVKGLSKAIYNIAVIFIAMLIFISQHHATKLSTLKS